MRVIDREIFAREKAVDAVLAKVRAEVLRAMAKHAPMHSSHEAFGVIFEEFNVEFVAEMVANNARNQAEEMVQVGAMAVRALVDVYEAGRLLDFAPDGGPKVGS